MARKVKSKQLQSKNHVDSLLPKEPQLRKKFHQKDIFSIRPKTDTQSELLESTFSPDNTSKNFYLHGSAGTGKTFLSCWLALNLLLDPTNEYEKIIIIRSAVPSRDVGFLKGDLEEKTAIYELPYVTIFDELFPFKKSYDNMKELGLVEFQTTSYLRGLTFKNCIVIVDEFQNCNFAELSTVISRTGTNSKLFMCGDTRQTDLLQKEKNIKQEQAHFKKIIDSLPQHFVSIEFGPKDIVRSSMVRDFLLACEKYSTI